MSLEIAILKRWFDTHRDETYRDYFKFLSFPSISTDPSYKESIRDTAEWLKNYLKQIGLASTLWETSGYPVVFASELSAGPKRPTLLLYHHYDVQPVDPLELWKSNPFTPVVRNNNVYARGAEDNKGQCFYSLTAIRAYLELAKSFGFNLKVFIEGEEESGGQGTAGILTKRKDELKCDHLLVVDGGLPAKGIPAIGLGTRGIITMNVDCTNSSIDLHSGTFGGIALNPNRALVTALSKLWNAKGKVAIPGFYEDVVPLTKEERVLYESGIADFPFHPEHLQKLVGLKAFAPEPDYSLIESSWIRPTVEINGISGGYAGEGFKTVIPSKANAKISCRLVPNQDPQKIGEQVTEFLKSQFPGELDVKITLFKGSPAFRSRHDSSIAKTTAKAYEEVLKGPCRYILMGGSIPIVTELSRISGGDTVVIGYGLDEDEIHAPNEHFGLDRFEQGFLTMGRIFSLLSHEHG